MWRREFIKTLAAGAAAVGLAQVAVGSPANAAPPGHGSPAPAPEKWELPVRGDPYTLSSGSAGDFMAAAAGFGADPIVAYGMPGEWRDRYVLGIPRLEE
jgi:hypothetical protein